MVVKIYISGISGNKEVKKRQQRVLMILDSKNINYEVIDITEPGKETDKDFMQNNAKSNGGTVSDPNPRSPLPPQMFNDEEYCGDYEQFDLANEVDTLEQFLKLEIPPEEPQQINTETEIAVNGSADVETEEKSKEPSQEKEVVNEDKDDVTTDSALDKKSPSKETSPAKESTPLRDDSGDGDKEESLAKEQSNQGTPKEVTPERQNSVDKDETETEKAVSPEKEIKAASKENTPEKQESVNENGTVSSRDHSEEKEVEGELSSIPESKKDNPSEALIESEQAAAVE